MTVTREQRTAEDLTGVVQAAFGAARGVRHVERLRGGTRKGVYRVSLDDATGCVVYVWNDDEDYWPRYTRGNSTEPPAVDLFVAAHAELSRCGIRIPELIMVDRSGTLVPGDVAVVEDIRGGTLEALWQRDPARAEPVLRRLGEAVAAMHSHQRAWHGRPGAACPPEPAEPVEWTVADLASRNLVEAAKRVPRIAAAERRLATALRDRLAAVTTPRRRFGLIHAELGPDHVLVDDQDRPVLIDIEGAVFLDVEWEHVFLELRFAERYHHLYPGGLDEARLRLYRLAMHLALVVGPLRLLDGDFPDREPMLDIVEHNIGKTLAQLD